MYPPIEPYKRFHLPVDHLGSVPIEIYIQLSGNPAGIPVVYLHGGPGDHAEPSIRQLFNPKVYHIIQFDQRGCGQSRPKNHLRKNTTPLLVNDMEAIRQHLGIQKFVVAGGSWGTTLAMAYAGKHPALGLILRGVYDLSITPDCVLDAMYPDLQARLQKLTRGRSPAKMLRSSLRRKYLALSNDPHPMYVTTKPHQDTESTQLTLTIVGNHYEDNKFFTTKRALYRGLKKITCPVYIVQGRYDLVTPPVMAYEVCKRLKNCTIHFFDGGHTFHDLEKGLVDASDALAKNLV